MRRYITFFLLIFTLSGVAVAQQMSDEQLLQYAKEAQELGKTQQQMQSELLRRGVTKEQVERVYKKYQEQQGNTTGVNKSSTQQSRGRGSATNNETDSKSGTGGNVNESLRKSDELELDQFQDSLKVDTPKIPKKIIFGHDIFTNKKLTFEPNVNLATPVDYILGPNDEVIIDVWGSSEISLKQTISPDGTIQVENLGPLYLSGRSVKEANNYIKREFSKIYSGIADNTSQIRLTLGEIRTIQIYIMGEVNTPGTYRLSSFSSVFHALYSAGGVNEIGSLRNIQVVRNNKKLTDVDVYDYILNGQTKDNIRLAEGDVILIPTYDNLIEIKGKIKRPMFYEMKKGESVDNLIKYAGGFTGDAYTKSVRLIRLSGREKQIYNVDDDDFSIFKLIDEDVVTVDAVLDRYENRLEIRGAVYRDGFYQLDGKTTTVKQLIDRAEGLRGDAFLNRAQVQREHDDLSLEIIPVDLRGIINGTVPDIPLQKNDILYIPSIYELQQERTLTIHGEVANPGTYIFTENTSIEDLIIRSGGLLDAASTARVDISRRIKDPKSFEPASTIGEVFSFELKDGLIVGNGNTFILKPHDEVYVRKSPGYQQQQNVIVTGEVLFSGNYALTKKNERLSDIIYKAGGITPDAYVKGARLLRKMTEEEMRRKEDVLRMATKGISKDSISTDLLDLEEFYAVGIDLQQALEKPGSNFDLVMREGDQLIVPEYTNTVKINGAVMYPNTVVYKEGARKDYYIDQAGGFADLARRNRVYVVYMNGTVARLNGNTADKIHPGCEIIVPSKEERKKMSTAEVIGIGTSVASMATMIATLVNLFK